MEIDLHKIAPHSAFSERSRSSVLTEAINVLEENPQDVEVAMKVATILTNFIAVPPAIEVSLFWKCISTGLIASNTLGGADSSYTTELNCLNSKLAEALSEAVFTRPEEVSLKRCIEELGHRAAAVSNSRKFCHELLGRLVSSICVVAKFERKTASEQFNRSVANLTKLIIQLNFPDPIEESLGKVISSSLSSSVDEFSSLLPIILLTSINEIAMNSKLILGIFVPVVEFVTTVSLSVEKREVVDNLCWQILKKMMANPSNEVVGDQHVKDKLVIAVTDFIGSQRASSIDPYLRYFLPFCVSCKWEVAISALLKSFFNSGRAEVLLKLLLEHIADDQESRKWVSVLIGSWLEKNFSINTPSFSPVWKFFLTKCFDVEKSEYNVTALHCFHCFLSGFQAFGNQESVLPSARADFSSLCLETVNLLSCSEFVDTALSEKQLAMPALDCIASATVILTLGEMENDELKGGAKTMRKLLKKYLKKCATFADNSSSKEHVLNALVTLCHVERDKKEHVEKVELFLAGKVTKKAFNVATAVNFYLRYCSDQSSEVDNSILVKLIDTWLISAPVNEFTGQQLILAIRLLDKRQCLDTYLSSMDVSSSRHSVIVSLLTSPKCLPLLSSLPQKVRSQLLERSLIKLEKLTDEPNHDNCPIDLIGHILQREADFSSFAVFEKCDVVNFMETLERHVDCDRQVVAKLSRAACNAALNDDKLFANLVNKFLIKRLTAFKASLTVCQCLLCLSRKIRTLHYKEPFQKLTESLDETKFCIARDKLSVEQNGLFALAACLVSLLDWPKFGRDKVSLEDIRAVCVSVRRLSEYERSLWVNPLIEVLSKCLKSSSTYEELKNAADALLSNDLGDFDLTSSAFVTVWQNVFKLAGKDAGRLLRHILFVYSDKLGAKKENLPRFGPLCSGYLKALITSCDNEEHSEEDHEGAVWLDCVENEPAFSPCPASEMVLALYEGVMAHPIIGIHCLPVVSQYGFFDAHTRGLLSLDLLLSIAVSAARCSSYLAKSPDHYTSYCSLLSSLLRLRTVQQENNDSNAVRLTNIIHIILFCLSAAFTTLLEFSLPQNNVAIYFQELSKLIAIASHRRRMLGDAVVHVVGATFVSAVRSPLPAGFAGLPPIFRKQLIAVVVQLFQMCSERALKSMALFLPQECLPLLKSVRSEAFVQRKARRKV